MKNQTTNQFETVNNQNSKTNSLFLLVSAVVIAILAIVIGVMASIAMNMNTSGQTPPVIDTQEQPAQTTESPEHTTEPPSQTTATPNTQITIIPGPDTPVTTTGNKLPEQTLPNKANGKYTVCVDPGHGYTDTGASSKYLGDVHESEIVMDIAHHVKDYLIDYGYNVIMTHEDNVIPAGTVGDYLFNKEARIEYVNSNFDYDYYISIHCDSFTQESVYGTRIYYHAPNGKNNSKIESIASYLKAGIANALPGEKEISLMGKDTKDAYYVCKYAKSYASLLVETGFVTNPEDAAKMLDEQWKKDMAKGIAMGIHVYLSGLN